MKNNKGLLITLILLLSVAVILLIVLLTLLLSKDHNLPKSVEFSFFRSGQNKLIYDKTYEEVIKNIEINSISSDISFKESNNNTIEIKVYGNTNNQVDEINTSNTVGINYKENSHCIGFCFNTSNSIVVMLPKSYSNKIKLSTKSGDISVIDLDNAKMNINSISGDLMLGNMSEATLKTVSGEIGAKNITEYIKTSTTSGDININSLKVVKDSSLKTVSGDINIDSINDIYVESKTVSGDIRVDNNNRHAKNELKLETVSGDITIR